MRLVVVSQAGLASYELPAQGTLVLGRSESSDVKVDDPSVGRRHAVLRVGDRLALEDLGSVNGTRVRGQRLSSRRAVELHSGEAFHLGTALLMVQAGVEPEPPARQIAAEMTTQRTQLVDDASTHAAPEPSRGAHLHVTPTVCDPKMKELYAVVDRIAAGAINVLVLGETGVGKELIAERVHGRSSRAAMPFLRLNCAALPEALLEAELFGYERGAFTGATAAKAGLLETADGGTIFLDEIGEMPVHVQAKLLRVLETRQVRRVGGLRPRDIDVRFVAATNRAIETEVTAGRFREDLYFRLNAATILVPPLRERVSEIEPLATMFLRSARREPASGPLLVLDRSAVRLLEEYPWPGNVRELKNLIERAALLATGTEILPEHFPIAQMASRIPVRSLARGAPTGQAPASSTEPPPSLAPGPGSSDPERARILEVLAECAGNQSRAAKVLGIARSTLVARLDSYGVPRPRKP